MKTLAVLLLLVLFGAGGYYFYTQNTGAEASRQGAGAERRPAQGTEGGGGRGERAPPVEVAAARSGFATEDVWAVGSLRSDESVNISAEISGRISEIVFKEGEPVKAGDVLIKLDDALAKAEVDSAQAGFDLAKSNYDRAEALSKSGNVTEKGRDEATSAFENAGATLELAKARLSKLSITAPFDGRAGLRARSLGAYVTPGEAIVNIEKIDQLKVDYRVPETVFNQVSVDQQVEVTVDALPGKTYNGAIYAINPQIDINGRSLNIRARLANPELTLRPGLFVRIITKGLEPKPVVLVPESAIAPRGQDAYVFIVKDGKAEEVKVTVGRRRAGEVQITQGLQEGMTVIVAGQTRLRSGASVEVIAAPATSDARNGS